MGLEWFVLKQSDSNDTFAHNRFYEKQVRHLQEESKIKINAIQSFIDW